MIRGTLDSVVIAWTFRARSIYSLVVLFFSRSCIIVTPPVSADLTLLRNSSSVNPVLSVMK